MSDPSSDSQFAHNQSENMPTAQSQVDWDPEIDTPATLAVIGGGPCGIEAALYGRFLGYSVELYETDKIGDSVLRWGQHSMPSPWRDLVSSLGLAALEAHDCPLPDLDQIPTCQEYVQQYLLPVARTDLLHDSIQNRTPVLSISRLGCSETHPVDIEDRAAQEFRLLLTSQSRGQFSQVFDLVLDCSGDQATRCGLASGGGIPIGWSEVASQVLSGKRAILGKERSLFSGKRVLLFGDDAAAAANALELDKLTAEKTRLFWVLPKRLGGDSQWLETELAWDWLSQDQVRQAKLLYETSDAQTVVAMAAWGIEAIRSQDSGLQVTLQKNQQECVDLEVDIIINCGDCLSEPAYDHNLWLWPQGQDWIVQAEPHFYVLGTRSQVVVPIQEHAQKVHQRGHSSNFVNFRDQIRRAFGMIGGRAELDLYQTVRPRSIGLQGEQQA
jgi:hypothetical protein